MEPSWNNESFLVLLLFSSSLSCRPRRPKCGLWLLPTNLKMKLCVSGELCVWRGRQHSRVLPPPECINAFANAKSSVCVELRGAKHHQDPTAQCEAFGFQSHASRLLPLHHGFLFTGRTLNEHSPPPLLPPPPLSLQGADDVKAILGGGQISWTAFGHLCWKKEGRIERGSNTSYHRVGLLLAYVDFLSQVALCMSQSPRGLRVPISELESRGKEGEFNSMFYCHCYTCVSSIRIKVKFLMCLYTHWVRGLFT